MPTISSDTIRIAIHLHKKTCGLKYEAQEFDSPHDVEKEVRRLVREEDDVKYVTFEDEVTGHRYMFDPEGRTGVPKLKKADGIWRIESQCNGRTVGRSFAQIVRSTAWPYTS